MLKKSAYAASTAVVFFMVLECVSRFYLFGFQSLDFARMNSMHPLGRSGLIQAAGPGMQYRLKSNLDTYFKMAAFRTNAEGWRDKEYSSHKAPGVFRVAVLGDSYTMASGVEIEQAFHSVLEDRLNAESRRSRYEFINFGVGGYVGKMIVAALKTKALAYGPDLILICLGENARSVTALGEGKFVEKRRENTFFKSFFIELLRHSNALAKKNKAGALAPRQIPPQAAKELENFLRALKGVHDSAHLPVCVVLLQHMGISDNEVNELKSLCGKYGLPFIDTSPAFKQTRPSEMIVNPLDSHPNAKAHKIFAQVIYDRLKEEHLLPVPEAQSPARAEAA